MAKHCCRLIRLAERRSASYCVNRNIHLSRALNGGDGEKGEGAGIGKAKPGSKTKLDPEKETLLNATAEVASALPGLDDDIFSDLTDQLSKIADVPSELTRSVLDDRKHIEDKFGLAKAPIIPLQFQRHIDKLKDKYNVPHGNLGQMKSFQRSPSFTQAESDRKVMQNLHRVEMDRRTRGEKFPSTEDRGSRERINKIMEKSSRRQMPIRVAMLKEKVEMEWVKKHPDGRMFGRDLFHNVEPLNIFNPEKWSSLNQQETIPMLKTWQTDRETELQETKYFTSNGFEDMIKWTEEGKLWKFPIDNEQGLEEEQNVPFYEHIFLDKHLAAFPSTGPVRKFMELVTLGLSKNPYLTVQEKIDHIQWFEEYFQKKQPLVPSETLLAEAESTAV